MFVIFCLKCINQKFFPQYKKREKKPERILSLAGILAPFASPILLFSLAFAQSSFQPPLTIPGAPVSSEYTTSFKYCNDLVN